MIARRTFGAVALSALLLAAAPLAQAKPTGGGDLRAASSPEAVGFDSGRLKTLDAYMAKVVADGRVAGMTTLLARHGQIVEFNSYGKASLATGAPMSKDAIVRIYSMTKPITGVAMMILFEQGKWRLDDPVTRYVPEFKNLRVMTGLGPDGKTIMTEEMKRPPTMREIMSHTAGFGYGLGDVHPVDKEYRAKRVLAANGLKEMIDRTATIPLMFQPGTNWSLLQRPSISRATSSRSSPAMTLRRSTCSRSCSEAPEDERHGLRRDSRAPPRPIASPPVYVGKTRPPARSMEAEGALRRIRCRTTPRRPNMESGRRRPRLHHDGLRPLQPDDRQQGRA